MEDGRKVGREGERGNVINFNAVSINHSNTNTHKRRSGGSGTGSRGIEGGREGAHLGSRWQQPRIERILRERIRAGIIRRNAGIP